MHIIVNGETERRKKRMARVKIRIMSNKITTEVLELKAIIIVHCLRCDSLVIPDQIIMGRAHVYALHCELMQDIGIVA